MARCCSAHTSPTHSAGRHLIGNSQVAGVVQPVFEKQGVVVPLQVPVLQKLSSLQKLLSSSQCAEQLATLVQLNPEPAQVPGKQVLPEAQVAGPLHISPTACSLVHVRVSVVLSQNKP